MPYRSTWMMTRTLLCLCVALFTAGCAGRMFYHPDHHVYRLPSERDLDYEDVSFESTDGVKLHGWFVKAQGEARGTVLHFHGNAQNMTAHFGFVDWLPARGYNVMVFDYRGYGQSAGHPTRKGLYLDGLAALRYAQARQNVEGLPLYVLGQSLGGAVALSVLGRNPDIRVNAAAIDSSFYSYRSAVRDKIGQMPGLRHIRWPLSMVVVGNSYSPGPVVGRISPTPLLFICGTADQVVSFRHSQALYEAAKEPRYFWLLGDAKHTEAFGGRFRDEFADPLVEFFELSATE